MKLWREVNNAATRAISTSEPVDSGTAVADICALMNELPEWAADLPIDAAGYECDFYQKD